MLGKFNALALGYSFAMIAGIGMLFLGIAGNVGVYLGAVKMMEQWHVLFNLSFSGIILGIIEASAWSFVSGWIVAKIYNRFI